MAHYDFVENSVLAYKQAWRARGLFLRMAVLPFFVKLVCYAAIFALNLEEQYLRQGLFLIPSYFAEGVFLTKVVQISVSNADKNYQPDPGNLAGPTVLYVLIKLMSAMSGGLMMDNIGAMENIPSSAQNPLLFLGAVFAVLFFIWAFRLLWLYIPLALGYRVWDFLQKVKGFQISFVMIGTWLICFVPLVVVFIFMAQIVGGILGVDQEDPSGLFYFILVILQSGMDILAAMVVTIAIGFGVYETMTGREVENKK